MTTSEKNELGDEFIKVGESLYNKNHIININCTTSYCEIHCTYSGWLHGRNMYTYTSYRHPNEYEQLCNYTKNH